MFDRDGVEEIAKRIGWVARNRESARAIRRRGSAFALEHLNWSDAAVTLAQFYRESIGQHRRT